MVSVDAKTAVLTLADGVEGILRASEISRDKVEDARNALKEGEEVEVKVVSVDRKTERSACLSKRSRLTMKKQRFRSIRTRCR